MLERITLKNFKLHASTQIDAAPITVFIGPNNSGKSSIFQSLLSLKQASAPRREEHFGAPRHAQARSPFILPDDASIDIGSFDDVVRKGEKEIAIGLCGEVPGQALDKRQWKVGVEFEVVTRDNKISRHQGSLETELGKSFWNWSQGLAGPPSTSNMSFTFGDSTLSFAPVNTFQMISVSAISPPPTLSPDKQADLRDCADVLAASVEKLIQSVHPIFPLRGFEEPAYTLPNFRPRHLDRIVLRDRSLALSSVIAYNRKLEDELSEWLQEIVGVGIRFHLEEGPRVVIKARTGQGNGESLFASEGSGANQLPFILVPIGLTPPGETILLSEPEAHLHPKAQGELTRLLLRIARKEKRQFFFETHSEHVLHSLLHAVAKGELPQSDLAIYYFENVSGEAKVTRLKIDERGGVEGGLPGFFDHALTELSELLETSKRK